MQQSEIFSFSTPCLLPAGVPYQRSTHSSARAPRAFASFVWSQRLKECGAYVTHIPMCPSIAPRLIVSSTHMATSCQAWVMRAIACSARADCAPRLLALTRTSFYEGDFLLFA